MVDISTFPLMPPRSTEARLEHFDETVYKADATTVIYKLIDALCGDSGAGDLKKGAFLRRLGQALENIYFSDLDYIFGSMGFLDRTTSESYDYDPANDMLTSEQWDEVRVKDSWYRARIRDFFVAAGKGGTPEGIRMATIAATSVDCDIYEVWRYMDCADEETEILTRAGYKHYSDLAVGDEVLTLNMNTELSEWRPVSRVNVYPAEETEMLSVEMGGRHSSLTTMNHRWPVSSRIKRADGSRGYSAARIRRSSELATEDRFIRAAPASDLPEVAKYTDALVELVAWFITEGHIHAGRNGKLSDVVTIVQSHAVNPSKVESIRLALLSLAGPAVESFDHRKDPAWREWVSDSKPDITVFRLNSALGRMLTALAPNKVTGMGFIHTLTRAQLTLFLDTCIDADGHTRKNGYRCFTQKEMDRTVPVQVVATLLGIPTSIQQGGDDWHVLSLCEKEKFVQPLGQGRKNAKTVRYTGTVWCPTTPNGTWFARRRGATYFTGNSFGVRAPLGRAPVGTRSEFVVAPHKSNLGQKELRLLRQMLTRIAPIDTICTIDPAGLSVHTPVIVKAAAADSSYFEVQKEVTGSPILADLPAPELLAIDLRPSEQWLLSGNKETAPYAAFNITQEYGYFYLISGGARSPIDSVSYGTLQANGTVKTEPNYESFQVIEQYTQWVEYDKADTPDNYPGGKFGLTPDAAPAVNPDGSAYVFQYTSQQAYVDTVKDRVLSQGGQADDLRFRLPIVATSTTKKTFTPDLAVAYNPPIKDSTVTSQWTSGEHVRRGPNYEWGINFGVMGT